MEKITEKVTFIVPFSNTNLQSTKTENWKEVAIRWL